MGRAGETRYAEIAKSNIEEHLGRWEGRSWSKRKKKKESESIDRTKKDDRYKEKRIQDGLMSPNESGEEGANGRPKANHEAAVAKTRAGDVRRLRVDIDYGSRHE